MLEITTMYTDQNLVDAGVWQEFQGGAEFLIASAENEEYKAYIFEETKRHKALISGKGQAAANKLKSILIEGATRHLVKDWRGVTLNGAAVDFNKSLVREFLTRSPDFRDFVSSVANDNTLYCGGVLEV